MLHVVYVIVISDYYIRNRLKLKAHRRGVEDSICAAGTCLENREGLIRPVFSADVFSLPLRKPHSNGSPTNNMFLPHAPYKIALCIICINSFHVFGRPFLVFACNGGTYSTTHLHICSVVKIIY